MGRNIGLVLTFFFSGLILIALAFLISKWMAEDSAVLPTLARIEKLSDPVFILRKHLTQKEKMEKKSSMRALETIETGPEGEAALIFPSSYRIIVLENSQITLDQEGEKTIVFIKSGNLKIENFGREGAVWISKDGQRWSATDFDQVGKNNQDAQIQITNDNHFVEGLTPSYVLDTLKSQKGIFYRCYTQLLQKVPGVSGETSLSITIERNGKVSRAEVTTTQIQDSGFKKCLLEAANRIEFKPFAGEAITTVFPLKFE